jgi:hypothetical protein
MTDLSPAAQAVIDLVRRMTAASIRAVADQVIPTKLMLYTPEAAVNLRVNTSAPIS